MLCKQFLVGALRPAHPSHELVTCSPGPRANNRVPLLQSAYLADLSHLLEPDGAAAPDRHNASIRSIHSSSVQHYISVSPPNKVLSTRPPEISPSETRLPRPYRSALAQLRSGHCSKLNTYKFKIGLSDTDLCPECGRRPHTTQHLFDCRSSPTPLSVGDLWTDPVAVARHLTSLTAFAALPPLGPPDRRPPPEPPPGARNPAD